jgi:hypothetical protein
LATKLRFCLVLPHMMPTKTSVGPNEVVRLEVLRLAPPLEQPACWQAAGTTGNRPHSSQFGRLAACCGGSGSAAFLYVWVWKCDVEGGGTRRGSSGSPGSAAPASKTRQAHAPTTRSGGEGGCVRCQQLPSMAALPMKVPCRVPSLVQPCPEGRARSCCKW